MINLMRFSNGFYRSLRGWRAGQGSVLLCLLALTMLCPLIVRGQELTATLSGIVTDSSGAVIPHASISIELNGVNAGARAVESDGSGNYVATNLAAGTYSITVTATGFETFKGKNIVLNVAEKHAFNVQLKAGAVSTTITVEDNPISVDTESAGQAGTITGTQIRELEIASRSFAQLVTLQPGVINAGLGVEANPQSNNQMAVNGARGSANNWTLDGADINDTGSNQTVVNTPSVDAIQEFTLQRGNYDAGYGRSGGGQVLVATKSGTSSFHGDAYEFVRNTDLDANDYFTKQNQLATGQKNQAAVNHHNAFGYTIGGPVYIPKLYNADKTKTFFFWSEEWHKIVSPNSGSEPAATTAMIGGVIPGQYTLPAWAPASEAACVAYDAKTNVTTISPTCFSQNAQVYLKDVFTPNPANDGTNYDYSFSAKNDLRDDIVRIDHYFNDKIHFFARGINDTFPTDDPLGMGWGSGSNYPGLVDTSVDSPGKNVVGNLTWTISPKAVNEFEFVWAQGTYTATSAPGEFATSSTALKSLTTGTEYYPDPYGRMPSVYITGVTGFSVGFSPYKERNLDRTYFDNLSYSMGKHTLRAGFQIQQMIKTENAVFSYAPGAGSNPIYMFNTFGDFLLGNVATFSQANRDVVPDLHFVNSEVYLQDDFKINSKLTVNLGVRWSFLPSPSDLKNTLTNFDPMLFKSTDAPTILPNGSMEAGTTNPYNYANGLIFPKGTACTYAQSAALFATCSPYGSLVNPNTKANFAPRIGFAYNPDGHGTTSIRGGFGIFYDRSLDGIWENDAFANPIYVKSTTILNTSFDAVSGGALAPPPSTPAGITSTGIPSFKVPDYANYNLSIQRQLLPTTTLEVAYVGNQARHLLGTFDQNQPTVSAWTNETGGASTESVNAIRPYAGYGTITNRSPIFTSNYNSLQISLNHRSNKGVTVGVAYTWSRTLTTNSADRGNAATNIYNMKLDYGPSNINTPQVFEASYVYDLPFFKAQHGVEGRILGGWEVSGITSMVSGQNFSIVQPYDPFDLNAYSGVTGNGIGLSGVRPDQVTPRVAMPKQIGAWFSPSAFAPAVGHFGSEGSNSILGPGTQNWDLAAIKNVKIAGQVSFQLRGEFFNAFNHTELSNPDANMADGAFGSITSVVAGSYRRVQIGAKLYF